jgi:hypothetical protein
MMLAVGDLDLLAAFVEKPKDVEKRRHVSPPFSACDQRLHRRLTVRLSQELLDQQADSGHDRHGGGRWSRGGDLPLVYTMDDTNGD